MTNTPSDLDGFRAGTVYPLTGLTGGDVGISPDASHLASGGYHVGCADIVRIGRWDTDYSTRQARDRGSRTSNDASAMDIGDNWPHGGRPAWLRFNNLLVAQLQKSDPALAPLRAVNFSPDGTATRRYDTNNRAQGVIASTDSVYMHTHLEWWRDTIGGRAACFARLGQIITAAIANTPLEDEMGAKQDAEVSNANRYAWALIADMDKITGIYNPDAPQDGPVITVTNTAKAKRVALEAKVDAISAGAVSQDAVDAAVAKALANPAILGPLVKAINDDAARRAAE